MNCKQTVTWHVGFDEGTLMLPDLCMGHFGPLTLQSSILFQGDVTWSRRAGPPGRALTLSQDAPGRKRAWQRGEVEGTH